MRAEYERRIASRREAAERHQRLSRTIGAWRLIAGVAGAVIAWWNFWLLPIPIAAFIALVVWHERVARSENFERRAIAWYERAMARLSGQWAGTGDTGRQFSDPKHPYADDLDVFGEGSLFQLINSARTAAGESALASWLKGPAGAVEVRKRQQSVSELRDRLDLREDVALLGEDIRSSLHADAVTKWGGRRPEDVQPWHRIAAFAISAALLLSFTGYMLQLWPATPMLLVLLIEILFFVRVRQTVRRIAAAVDMPARDLRILSSVLERLEREPLESVLLVELKKRLEIGGLSPSKQISRLRRLIEYRDQARNQMFAIVAEPLLWSVQFYFAIERWRQVSGPHIGEWIAAVGDIEALSSMAGYSAEHPADPFPELLDEGPLFQGEGIAHPLIPEATAVRNDVRLDGEHQLLVVSGSNMSGKSTLLRSVGLNTVLAWAGGPVRAGRLRVSRLAVGASMRVQDSVLDGKSRFYAEVTRLRQVVDMAGSEPPLLYLLDELLSGTNSHDRRIGTEAVVRTLLSRRAIGLITTHDLALAEIADALAPRAINVHFEDHIEEGRIAFDYRMRPGVVRKSNALELMRSVGLEV